MKESAQITISISINEDLVERADRRADDLGLTRSRYVAVIIQQDLERGGPLMLAAGDESKPVPQVELTPWVIEFLKIIVPILNQYQDSHGQAPLPEVSAAVAETELWKYFLKHRDEILKDKWIQSRNAGYDIGMERAARTWLQRNHILWPSTEDTESPDPASPTPPAAS